MATKLPDEERSGRQISFWLSHEEIAGLERRAKRDHITRNATARAAIRAYTN